jgi:hypothetical protein
MQSVIGPVIMPMIMAWWTVRFVLIIRSMIAFMISVPLVGAMLVVLWFRGAAVFVARVFIATLLLVIGTFVWTIVWTIV